MIRARADVDAGGVNRRCERRVAHRVRVRVDWQREGPQSMRTLDEQVWVRRRDQQRDLYAHRVANQHQRVSADARASLQMSQL